MVRRLLFSFLLTLAAFGGSTAASAYANAAETPAAASAVEVAPVPAGCSMCHGFAPKTDALGVDGMVQNPGGMNVGLICGVITGTYNYVLRAGYNTPRGTACQGYYVGLKQCMNLLRYHDGQWFYSAVNVGRGQHYFRMDGLYQVNMRPDPAGRC